VTLATVFVSRPAVLTPDQEAMYERWSEGLTALGFALMTIPRTSYTASPWFQLRNAVGGANGAVILGFRQAIVERGRRRPGTPEETSAAGWYASAWSQVEAGLAVMADLPVLVVPEGDASEGVFSTDVWRDRVYGTQMDVWTAGDGSQEPSLREWAMAVRRHAESLRESESTAIQLTNKSGTTTEEPDETYPGLEDEIRRHDARAVRARRIHRSVHALQRATAASLPIMARFGSGKRWLGVAGALALALSVMEDAARWQDEWWLGCMTAEALKHERFLFLARAGPYADAQSALDLLRERMEGVASQEHARFVSARQTSS
jgi:hypothetical protein